MATIEDVAKLAGLSRTTVSRVINNHPYVTEEKKRLVQDAMAKLGYVPNSSARSLRSQKTEMIAVLVSRIMNPYFSSLIEAMEMRASDKGYQLIVCQTRYSPEKELNYLNLLKTRQVDGVILASIQSDWPSIKPFLDSGPIVLCNEFVEDAQVPMVRLNQIQGAYIATKHLLDLGHKRIAYCCGIYRSNTAVYREHGFTKALQDNGVEFDEDIAFRNALTIDDGRRIFHEIASLTHPPTAVFTGSDEVAAGLITEAKRYGWTVPEDLAVVGYDDQQIAELIEPTITTVYQPAKLLAELAVDILIEKIKLKVHKTREVHEFPLELIVRNSTVPHIGVPENIVERNT
ncbi:LacI family transcriptional regulator [Bacillus sp. HMF5848]|uniref:LacI family DNA-binding transcriptional regulator n=1 Tax=Bacillus sp. HMF5848 TaxID=2495421 RepID=UPI000F78B7E3|nr:LacI family DNA-binding transcriptional regulator [Bacillus sp. HMF5848]RSK26214.1 LacI family transcriptional regulator [Bacillus sp. HMF5848]